MADPINPDHYRKHPSGIECIEVTRFMNFNKGNAVKYIWRAGEKGNEIQDLEKAVWYLQDEIALLKAGHTTPQQGPSVVVPKEALVSFKPGGVTSAPAPSAASELLQTVGK